MRTYDIAAIFLSDAPKILYGRFPCVPVPKFAAVSSYGLSDGFDLTIAGEFAIKKLSLTVATEGS